MPWSMYFRWGFRLFATHVGDVRVRKRHLSHFDLLKVVWVEVGAMHPDKAVSPMIKSSSSFEGRNQRTQIIKCDKVCLKFLFSCMCDRIHRLS